MLANLPVLPAAIADLLRAYPFDFLYGNIAADSSIAKHYAPLGRHCHYWHVGQEIHDLAESDALRAFGLGYLCHLSADTVAHNYFVPRQLMLTSSTASGRPFLLGDPGRGPPGRRLRPGGQGRDPAATTPRPTRTSTGSSRRRSSACGPTGGSSAAWCTSPRPRAGSEPARWLGSTAGGALADQDVERHLGLSFDYMMELLGGSSASAHQLDPSGERPLKAAKDLRRRVLRAAGRRNPARLREAALEHFGLPDRPLEHWIRIPQKLPWRAPEGSAPSPKALVNGRRR